LLVASPHPTKSSFFSSETLIRNGSRVEVTHPRIVELEPLVFLLFILLLLYVGIVMA